LLTAQLNLAVGAEYCPAVDEAVRAAQLLLVSRDFDGTGSYFSMAEASRDRETTDFLVQQLRNATTVPFAVDIGCGDWRAPPIGVPSRPLAGSG
jgi:hypothetical protein